MYTITALIFLDEKALYSALIVLIIQGDRVRDRRLGTKNDRERKLTDLRPVGLPIFFW